MDHPGNRLRHRTPAQLAARAAAKLRYGGRKRGPKFRKRPDFAIGSAPSTGIIGPAVKTIGPQLRAMIDAALAGRD